MIDLVFPVYFRAQKTSSDGNQTSITSGQMTKCTYPTEYFDVSGFYDAANSKWTPPAGKVWLRASLNTQGTIAVNAVGIAAIYKNGGMIYHKQERAVANNNYLSIECLDEANGTDYYEGWFSQVVTGYVTFAYGAITQFAGRWIAT